MKDVLTRVAKHAGAPGRSRIPGGAWAGRAALALGLVAAWIPAARAGSPAWEREAPAGEVRFGARVARAGDIDADGREDVFVSANDLGFGRVYVLSGDDGSFLRTFTGNQAHAAPAHLVSAVSAGDFDGDGVPDFILGARGNTAAPPTGEPGYIAVVSGKPACDGIALSADCQAPPDECVLRRLCGDLGGEPREASFGDRIANVGDLNGDGTIEILAGIPGTSIFSDAGEARLFSGADGSVLLDVFGSGPQDSLGYAVAGLGDVTGDGVPDFAIGSPGTYAKSARHAGRVLIYSGASLSLVRTLKGKGSDAAGTSVADAGRVNGDLFPDIAYGSPGHNRGSLDRAGQVRLSSGRNGKKLRQVLGTSAELALGSQLVALGDVDGDGGGDFATGSSATGVNGGFGMVAAYSGKCGCGLYSYDGEEANDGTGAAVGAADVTGDGRAELVIGAPDSTVHPGGIVRVFSIQ